MRVVIPDLTATPQQVIETLLAILILVVLLRQSYCWCCVRIGVEAEVPNDRGELYETYLVRRRRARDGELEEEEEALFPQEV